MIIPIATICVYLVIGLLLGVVADTLQKVSRAYETGLPPGIWVIAWPFIVTILLAAFLGDVLGRWFDIATSKAAKLIKPTDEDEDL